MTLKTDLQLTVTSPLVLGKGKKGKRRRQALLDWADEMGLTWGSKPSISKLVQMLADYRIAHGKNTLHLLFALHDEDPGEESN